MVVVWSQDAKLDLKNYVQNSKIYTKGKLEKYICDLTAYVNSLQDFPLLGKSSYFYRNIEIRELVFKIHKIFYYN